MLSVQPTLLGSSINKINFNEAKSALQKSNVFILSLKISPPILGEYPFNLSMNEIRPKLHKLADQEFIKLGDYTFNNQIFRVYVKS